MRKICALLALLSAVDVACAQEGPVVPSPVAAAPAARAASPYNWTGVYVGVNGGWEFEHVSDTATVTPDVAGGFVGVGVAGFPTSESASSSSNGNAGVAGGQLGFNWQAGGAVFGIEGDFDWSGQKGTRVVGSSTDTSQGPWFATIRGRFGAAFDRLLIYGTAGAAFVDISQNISLAGYGTLFNESQVDYGWTAGAGVEGAFMRNWTARVEYLFVDTDLSLSGPLAGAGTLSHSGTIARNIVRGGLNYKFQ